MIRRLLDRVLLRRPFEGASAVYYEREARPAFGDLDARLLDRLAPALAPAGGAPRRLLDVGCGPGVLMRAARARFPALEVVGVDASRTYARGGVLHARAEALPFPDRSFDVAVCLSSIRHVRDRAAALRELRRVVRERAVIVELDPAAEPAKIAAHAARFRSAVRRRTFGPLVVRTAPPAAELTRLAAAAGFAARSCAADPVQPVYVLELA